MEVYFISLPVYGRLALLGRDQALFEGFYLEIGKWRGNFKGEVLETGARLYKPSRICCSELYQCSKSFVFFSLSDYSFEVPSS